MRTRGAACGVFLTCAVLVTSASCKSSQPAPLTPAEPESVTFAQPFLWGSASAGFQVEKGLDNTDWGTWVKTPGKIKNGDNPDIGGADALAHIDEDVALLAAAGQNAYRFSIEWARIYPTRAAFDADMPDPAGIASYDKLFAALHAAKITPFVTLQHFALPDYLSDPSKSAEPQGWERPELIGLFGTWCGRVAKRWGKDVDWWGTINEPLVAPIAGYIQGSFPPGLILAVDRALTAGKNEARAHGKCFDAIKANDTVDLDLDGKTSMVGIVHNTPAVEPEDPTYPDDVAAADRVRYINNHWILNAVVRGDWDDDFYGKYDGPNDKRADPDLVGRSDYIGINYYSALWATVNGLQIPVINAFIRSDHLPNDRPKTDFFWDIYPGGFRIVLEEANRYGPPIVINSGTTARAAFSTMAASFW